GGDLNLQNAWQTASFTNIACNTTASPITRRLVFSLRNDGSIGTQPPGAIDNISVVAVPYVPPICNLGTGVTNVISLPYNSGAGTTCGAGNDLTSSNTVTCGSSLYLGGEDRVWVFTAPSTGVVNVTLTSSGTWTGLMVYNSCPLSAANCGGSASCVASATSSSGSKSLCFNATAGTTYYVVLDSWPSPTCNAYTNLSISAPVPPTTCTLAGTYTVSSIAHNPDVLTSANLSGFTDDIFYPGGTISTGFDFCLNGNQYQNFLISANGYVIFDPPSWACGVTNLPSGVNAVPNGFSGWSIDANLPNTTNAPRNAILAPWHDIDPSITGGGANPRIRYQVFGTAPNRRFVVSWETVPMYSCGGNRSLDFTGQIKMFETTNNIEIHLTQKRVCASWNSGRALLGLHNYNGTEALVPAPATTYNNISTTWTATNQAWRFTFNPTTCTTCSPLPLNLLYFNGEFDKEALQSVLTWSFKTPAEVEYFIVERSQDEVNFTEIGKVGFSASNQYRFIDEKPLRNTNIYRLKQVDKSGKTEYSHYVRVYNPVRESWAVERVYPNPAQNVTHIDLVSLFEEAYQAKLYNLQGVEVYEQKGSLNKGFNSLEIKFGSLQKGTYLLLFTTPSQMYQHKLVIELP
ncbi:MAG: T9SS type A sorting domain-containing protein, partial [Raineya sp.]